MDALVINFSHPLSTAQREEIRNFMYADNVEVMDVRFQLDIDQPLYGQVREIFNETTQAISRMDDEGRRYVENQTVDVKSYVNEHGLHVVYTDEGSTWTEKMLIVNLPTMSMAAAQMYSFFKEHTLYIGRLGGYIRMKVAPNELVTRYVLAEIVQF